MTGKSKAGYMTLGVAGLVASVAPPVAAALSYFPLWKEQGYGQVLSGGTLIILLIACVPLWKQIKSKFKSPDALLLWIAIYAVLMLINNIIDQMLVISFCGMVGNGAGKLLFLWQKQVGQVGKNEVTDNG